MRYIKLAFLCFVLLGVFAGDLRAQYRCDDPIPAMSKLPSEQAHVNYVQGVPGQEVLVPIFVRTDTAMTGFRFLVQFDSSKLTPVYVTSQVCDSFDTALNQCVSFITDTNYVDFVIGDGRAHTPPHRFLKDSAATDSLGRPIRDTITQLQCPIFKPDDTTIFRNVISCNFIPSFSDLDTVRSGTDTLFFLKFRVKPTAPIGSFAPFRMFEYNQYYVFRSPLGVLDSTLIGCVQSNMSLQILGGTYNVWPATNYTYGISGDSTPVPQNLEVVIEITQPSVTLSASPTTLPSTGGSVTLTFTSANVDSVVIRDGANNRIGPNQSPLLSPVVINVTASTTYTAYGYKSGTAVITSSPVTVTVGSTGGAPTVTSPQLIYTLKAGETVSFTVSATDAEGGQITLSANSATMPLGASFPSATNLNSVSSSFSWVPSTSQVGTFQIQFRAQDPQGNVGTLTVTIVVEQLQFDRLFSTSVEGQRPVGGLPGKEGVFFPVNLVSSKTVYGIQFDLNYPRTVLTVDSVVPSGRIPEYVIYDNIGQTPGDIRVVTFGLNNEPVLEQDTADTLNPTAVLFVVVSIDSTAVPWNNARMRLTGGRESINPNPNIGSVELVTDSGVIFIDQHGDVNLDQIIDVADPVSIVGNIIGNFNLTSRQFDAGDVITDVSIDVFDLVADVNLIYGIPVTPAPIAPKDKAIVSLAYTDMTQGSQDILKVKSELPEQIAGVQLELQYDPSSVGLGMPSKTADNGNFTLQYRDDGNGRLKIVLYHMAPFKENELLQVGTADLVNVPIIARSDIKAGNKSQLRLIQALLSTSTAGAVAVTGVDASLPETFVLRQNYPNPFNPSTTIEFFVAGGSESQVNLDIFNILGQRVKTLVDGPMSAGEHKVEWDATSNSGQRVATGVYLYRLTVGSESQTRKMLFLK